ncbi:flagellar assembly protein FliH [Saccharospirillum mangrovi]|uniref:flagellar assembly protein FliH n=1 Tax=Saccharospirillum mangrovi TaxID=2161747 RepID=UPI000D3701CB|nr:flagellar assembly protein FliH [Saccharospirillum mangrovi]
MVFKPPLHPDEMETELDVEAYRLPRWDAKGNLIDDRPKPIATITEDVEDVQVQPPTAEEIRQIHDAAYNEGFESGYQQGMKQGQQEGHKAGHQEGYAAGEEVGRGVGEQAGYDAALKTEQARIAESLAPLQDLLTQLQGLLPKQEADLRDGLVTLAVRLARNLFDAELALKPDHIQALVHNAVQALPNADERLTIELHPDDLALVETMADSHWTLQADPELRRGGCRVRSRFSYIDYSLEHRFRQQVSNLLAQSGLSERLEELSQPWPLPSASTLTDDSPLQAEHNPGEILTESGVTTTNETTAGVAETEVPAAEPQPTEATDSTAVETDTPVTDESDLTDQAESDTDEPR